MTELQSMPQDKLDLIKRTVLPQGATNDELELFLHQVQRTGLDPLARQIYATKVGGRIAISPTIDGFRLIADRTGKYEGQLGPEWCAEDGVWRDVWIGKTPPAAARVGVLRSDFKEPLWGIATWKTYAKYVSGKIQYNWDQMGDLMLAKCAEAQALRKAFPQELSGLYEPAELEQAETQIQSKPPKQTKPTAAPPETTKPTEFTKKLKTQFKELSTRIKTYPDSIKDAVRPLYTEAITLIDFDSVKASVLYSQIEQALENETLANEVIDIELRISTLFKEKGLIEEDWQADLDPFRDACKKGDNARAIEFGMTLKSLLEGA